MSAITDEPGSGLSRRNLLGVTLVGAASAVTGAERAEAKTKRYPRLRVIELERLRVNRAVRFDYPLEGQASYLVDLGRRVPGGVGPKRSIVAYSALCQHMGCAVEYRRRQREFFCPCHQSRYDAERLGSLIQGVATRALPRVKLQVRGGAVHAIGVDGLIYGYRSNLEGAPKARSRS